jgi:glycine dehydrogenase
MHESAGFPDRHIGPDAEQVDQMLEVVGCDSLQELVDETIPDEILDRTPLGIEGVDDESEMLEEMKRIGGKNDPHRSFIGQGYHDTILPPVLQRNILEDPSWYTHYTPYQSEIAQGRLEALINFQTMVSDLTGLEIANSSLLDEGTAAAEAMSMLHAADRTSDASTFLVSEECHPQTIAVLRTRAEPVGIDVEVRPTDEFEFGEDTFGALLQYPTTDGAVENYESLCSRAHDSGAHVAVAADLLSLTLLRAPGEFGADVAIGTTQRFGVPLGFGGPHAAYFACREQFKRKIPGRLIGVSKDGDGEVAYRMALQTREQHIRRERATSNICTAQVLLAVIAGMYGCYHGPDGLTSIARRIHRYTKALADGLRELGHDIRHEDVFDTLRVDADDRQVVLDAADDAAVNFREFDDGSLGISLDEATDLEDLQTLLEVFGADEDVDAEQLVAAAPDDYQGSQPRRTDFMDHENFHEYRSETDMMRYLDRLASRDISLTDSMIPLGSCTMKLNAAVELMPISWPEFNGVHPYAPLDQNDGYRELIDGLRDQIRKMTGLPAVTVQPNSGAQGEYTGLLAIRNYHKAHGDEDRRVCLIPESAHGTNAASASMANMEIVSIECDDHGNVDLEDLEAKAEEHADRLAGAMFTYPSTHGVFEEDIKDLCEAVHRSGGLVYLDGANMNPQVGLCRLGDYGVDVCHLNLHKTFSIPHGGGGPGVGPVAATEQLEDFLPDDPLADEADEQQPGPVAAAPFGSASILPISYSYIRLMGDDGLRRASETAILNANYMADRIDDHYEVLYRGNSGRVAHEFIVDPREFDETAGINAEDIAKRLIDYGFHAPTMSWPVHGTLMIEPTESESKDELDRFCDALISIREEIQAVEDGEYPEDDNPLVNAPHTSEMIADEEWNHAYSRQTAVFPSDVADRDKFWPPVRRVNNTYGDRNLFCSCPPPGFFEDE